MGNEEQLLQWLDDLFSVTSFGFLWFAMIAAWGGTASYLTRLKKSRTPFSIMELVGEWTISAFAGIITMYVCLEMELSAYATAALVAIAGHMGGRGIALFENAVELWWERKVGRNEDQPK